MTEKESGPDVPDTTPRPLVADEPHFRVVDEHTSVLYLPGAHVAANHADLPTVIAVQLDGVWRPLTKAGRKR